MSGGRNLIAIERSLILAAAAWLPLAHAADLSGVEGDAFASDKSVGLIYFEHVETSDLYANGFRVSNNYEIASDIAYIRYIDAVPVGPSWTLNPQFILPFGELQ